MEADRPRSTSDWNDMSFSDPAPRILQTKEMLAFPGVLVESSGYSTHSE